MGFNYKDWWSYVYWIIVLYVIIDVIKYYDNWVRWKWGYYNTDLIPSIILLCLLGYFDIMIKHNRLVKEFNKLKKQKGDN